MNGDIKAYARSVEAEGEKQVGAYLKAYFPHVVTPISLPQP